MLSKMYGFSLLSEIYVERVIEKIFGAKKDSVRNGKVGKIDVPYV